MASNKLARTNDDIQRVLANLPLAPPEPVKRVVGCR